MARPKTEIEVTVQDRASCALRTIRERFGALNNGRVERAMAQVARATDQATSSLKYYAAARAVLTAGGAFMVKGVVDTAAEFERYHNPARQRCFAPPHFCLARNPLRGMEEMAKAT